MSQLDIWQDEYPVITDSYDLEVTFEEILESNEYTLDQYDDMLPL